MSSLNAPELTDHVIAGEQRHRLPGAQSMTDLAGIVVARAANAEIWDLDGNRYLDLFTGVGVCNIGHAHPAFRAAVSAQLDRCIVSNLYTSARSRFYELLAAQLPPGLRQIHMFSTGSEAVEAAVKFARAATGRHEVVSFWGGFHGKTQGALVLHGGPRRHRSGPFPPGVHHVPYAYCYRCPFQLEHPSCDHHCVDFAEQSISHGSTGDVAAIIVEPIQGTNGNIIPPRGYLARLRELADRLGALLILDEAITGFGRTGTMFCFQQEDRVVPDVLVLGKSMASGVPASAVVSRSELVEGTSFAVPSAAASTFGGNPLASAASLATLEILLAEDLPGRARKLGDVVAQRIASWPDRFPVVGHAANAGLVIGVELVLPGTTDPLPKDRALRIFEDLKARGVLAMAYDAKIRIYPPLTIPTHQLDEALDAFEAAFHTAC
ncbi:aspartate aminotransferase family protein [Saccharomonospora sp. NB11]|uniref:aspartate aminotransferase family protein n=1 Tax=Saccharomonospora sp. NB11 TaxID=1642298 RepID=UPI0018CFEEC0|nr:aspartate aminotransferase family protein [Saccharomonospora sp. NB11]